MQSQNQFSQSPEKGMLDLRFNTNTISGSIDVSSAGGLVPGQAVKMVDSVGGAPKFVECAADSDDVFGFINYNIKQATFKVGDAVEVSYFRGNVMYMEANAAIARNGKVMIVIATKRVATATTGKMIVGRAIDKATAQGQLIRVVIDLPGTLAP